MLLRMQQQLPGSLYYFRLLFLSSILFCLLLPPVCLFLSRFISLIDFLHYISIYIYIIYLSTYIYIYIYIYISRGTYPRIYIHTGLHEYTYIYVYIYIYTYIYRESQLGAKDWSTRRDTSGVSSAELCSHPLSKRTNKYTTHVHASA